MLRPRGPSRSGLPIWIGASRPRLLQACQRVGRDPATLEVTVGTAVELLAPGQQPQADTAWITGSAEHIAEELRAFAKAGVTHLIVSFEPEGVASIEQFARVVEMLNQG